MNINDFLVELERIKTIFEWKIIVNSIRGYNNKASLCPLTAVCFNKDLGHYLPHQFLQAGKNLNMREDNIEEIVLAADGMDTELRKKMIEILGVKNDN